MFLYDRISPEKIPDMTELPKVIQCLGVKWHVGRSHYSWTVEWRKAASIDKVSKRWLSHLKSIWSKRE